MSQGFLLKEKLAPTTKTTAAPSLSATNAEYLRKLEKTRKGQRRRRKGRRDDEEEEEVPVIPLIQEETPVVEEEEDVRDRRRRGRRHRGREDLEKEKKAEEPKKEIPETELQQRRKLQTIIAQPPPQHTEKVPKRAYNPEAIMEESKNFDLLYGIQLSLEHHKKEQLKDSGKVANGGGGAAGGESHEHKARGNANHLLNFQFNTAVGPGPNTARTYQPVKKKKGNVFKKEAFLQANCHFVLSPGGDTRSLADPEHVVDWMAVEQVYMPTETVPVCPICLESPVAGKITRCGHIFCSACMLHYLSLSQKSWARCPLCFESIYKKALKSVSFRVQEPCVTGQVAQFLLIKRAKGSLIVSLEESAEAPSGTIEKGDVLDNSLFARITVTTDISSIIAREYSELTQALQSPGLDINDTIFLRQAVEELAVRQQLWDEQREQRPSVDEELVKPNLQILKRPSKIARRSSQTFPSPLSSPPLNVPSSILPQTSAKTLTQHASEPMHPPSPVVQPSCAPMGPITILKRQPSSPFCNNLAPALSAHSEPSFSSPQSPSLPSLSVHVLPPLEVKSKTVPPLRVLQRPAFAKGQLVSTEKAKNFFFNPNAREFSSESSAPVKAEAEAGIATIVATTTAVTRTVPSSLISSTLSTNTATTPPATIIIPPATSASIISPAITASAFSSSQKGQKEKQEEDVKKGRISQPAVRTQSESQTAGSIEDSDDDSGSNSSNSEGESSESEEDEGDEEDKEDFPAFERDENSYHFYQRIDGACVFLHSFNYRCLLKQFETEEHFPLKLTGKIVYLDKYIQTDETIQTMRFLSHLPLGTPFFVALADLSEVLSRSTIKAFATELAELETRRVQEQKRVAELIRHRLSRLGAYPDSVPTTDPGLVDHSQLPDTGFALADAEGQFPELMQDAHNLNTVTPLGWNEVAEKGFCANFWSPSLADAQATRDGNKPATTHKLGGAAAASLSLLSKPRIRPETPLPNVPTGVWNKHGPAPKKLESVPPIQEKSKSSWDSPVTPLYSDSLISSQFSALTFSSSTSAGSSTCTSSRANADAASWRRSSSPLSLSSSSLPFSDFRSACSSPSLSGSFYLSRSGSAPSSSSPFSLSCSSSSSFASSSLSSSSSSTLSSSSYSSCSTSYLPTPSSPETTAVVVPTRRAVMQLKPLKKQEPEQKDSELTQVAADA